MQKILITLLSLCLAGLPFAAQAEPDLVILVRHAEKATDQGNDPGLSEAGQSRAQTLARVLQHSAVSSIYTSHYKRTHETAQALAQAQGITAQVVQGSGADHLQQLLAAVRASMGTVLVVGHGNTVPALAMALGAPAMKDFCESSFSHMLVLRPSSQPGKPAELVQAHYGEADIIKPSADCQ
ncbi:histidine phosphatase family protein [Undibacterium sp. JH2W]|uniref:histidine phosphatase family protein n=1 Tax=Undibacterium sp. JH2W TaxID=3413037 RepID=UPI003BF15A5A